MAQYIDKSALVAEIERRMKALHSTLNEKETAVKYELKDLLSFIDTLEVKEVDLNGEIPFQWSMFCLNGKDRESFVKVAKHFFELGLSVSNSTKVTTPDIDDVLKENGVNPDSKEAKVFKESYYMALEKFKAQKGEL